MNWNLITDAHRSDGGATLSFVCGTMTIDNQLLYVAVSKHGLYKVVFAESFESYHAFVDQLSQRWPEAEICNDDTLVSATIKRFCEGDTQNQSVLTEGTQFQRRVWAALLDIKRGEVATYSQLAERLGRPTAVRAVASAIAANELAILIPCHRVIRKGGALGGYRWGLERKQALINQEKSYETALP